MRKIKEDIDRAVKSRSHSRNKSFTQSRHRVDVDDDSNSKINQFRLANK